MTITINTMPHKSSLYSDYLSSMFSIEDAHSSMVMSFDAINTLYSESSITEDIILNKYLYLYGAAKLIQRVNGSKSSFITESFLSQNFFDKEFPITNPLNIDTHNGDLTLPIISTNNAKIGSIIIESDSNGTPGDSQNENFGSDISAIVNGDSSSLFTYEKIVNSLSMSSLYLTLTMNLNESSLINGVYLRLYSDTGAYYPNIDMLEGSNDGEVWFEIASQYKIEELKAINKVDYFIRFQSKPAKMIRVRLSQSGYSSITTGFGTRYRYMIGIREISVKQTIYNTTGEYISTPFTNKQAISYVKLEKEDSGDVKYFISANNGTKWISLKPKEKQFLYNDTLGLRDGTDINSVRLKVQMSKESIAINKDKVIEYAPVNTSETYYLKEIPIEISAKVGGHISYGDMQEYQLQLSDLNLIDPSILEDDADVSSTAVLYYVPYFDGIENYLTLKINRAKIKNDRLLYEFSRHEDKNHTIITFKNKLMLKNSGVLTVNYKKIAGEAGEQVIDLPSVAFNVSNSSFIVEEILVNGTERTLKESDYAIINGQSVSINDNAYNPELSYQVSYQPSVDITDLISIDDTNELKIHSIKEVRDIRVCFEYTTEASTNSEEIKYFTPICNQYILELK